MLWGCALAIAGSGWAPPRGVSLPDVSDRGWRDARVAEGARYVTAVDAEGRLLVATLDRGGELRIRRLEKQDGRNAWVDVFARVLDPPDPPFGISTDARGVVVGLHTSDRVVVHRIPGWEVAWETALTSDIDVHGIGVDTSSRTVLVVGRVTGASHDWTVLAGQADRPWETVGVVPYFLRPWGPTAGRLAWSGWGYELDPSAEPSRVVWSARWSWPENPTDPPGDAFAVHTESGLGWRPLRSSPFGEPLPVSGGSGPELQVWSRAAFTDTHYGTEANRLRIEAASGPLTADGETVVVLPDTEHPQVYETDPPSMSFSHGRELFVAEWNGTEWWGIGGEPRPDRGLPGPGDADRDALTLIGDRTVDVVYNDLEEGARLVSATRKGRSWTSKTLVVPGSGRLPCSDGEPRWRAVDRPGSVIGFQPMCDGTHARLSGSEEGRWGFVRRADGLEPLPHVPYCPRCVFRAGVALPDGDVLAALGEPEADSSLSRLSGGRWSPEPLPWSVAGVDVERLGISGDTVWAVLGRTLEHHVMALRGPAGWEVLDAAEGTLGTWQDDVAVGAGVVHVLWTLDDHTGDTWRQHLMLATHRDGRWATRKLVDDIGFLDSPPQVAVRSNGSPVVAWATREGIRVLEVVEDGSVRGLDGEDIAWSGRAGSLDLSVDRRDRVCVAFTAQDVRFRRVGMVCHR